MKNMAGWGYFNGGWRFSTWMDGDQYQQPQKRQNFQTQQLPKNRTGNELLDKERNRVKQLENDLTQEKNKNRQLETEKNNRSWYSSV